MFIQYDDLIYIINAIESSVPGVTTPGFLFSKKVILIPQYIPFTQQQKEQAAATDLEAFLQSRGEKLIRSGREDKVE